MSDDDRSADAHPLLPQQALTVLKGRGAVSNLQGRYEMQVREHVDDAWPDADLETDADNPPAWKTQVFDEQAKSILTRNASPDLPFRVSLNPYRGCEHGCIYCFARPTHSYLGLSPGLDFESKVFAKVNAPELLRRELVKASYVPEPIALDVNTDAYQPRERELRLTRRVLRLPWEANPLFQQWLQAHFPERAQRVMNRVRDMRDGKDYDAGFGTRMRGEGVWADLIRQRFEKAVNRLGLGERAGGFKTLDETRFRRPVVAPARGTGKAGNLTGSSIFFSRYGFDRSKAGDGNS